MFILHLALGGCLGPPPIRFGLTADTGGHIAYVLGAAKGQSKLARVRQISIVTRLFDDDRLGLQFARISERLDAKTTIDRIATENRAYLEKEALARDLPAFVDCFCRHLAKLPVLPDIIHAHFADAAFIAEVARARFGIPFVYTPHALGIDKQTALASSHLLGARIAAERRAIATADAIVVSTQNEIMRQVAAYAVHGLADRIECIAPGVPAHGQCRSTQSGIITTLAHWLKDPAKPILLAIARPVRKKNLAALLRAYRATPALRERANLVILAGQHGVGLLSEEERHVVANLEELCDNPALRGRVALPPKHDAADVAALYRRAAAGGVFVNPALHEPFGLTLIEAAAAGVPVVATRFGGPADIIATIGHGLLVDPHNERDIGAACLRLISDLALHGRLSQAGRENASIYDWSRYAERSVALYASLKARARLSIPDIVPLGQGADVAARQVAA